MSAFQFFPYASKYKTCYRQINDNGKQQYTSCYSDTTVASQD